MEKYIRTSWHPKISEVAYTLLEWLKDYQKLEDEITYLEHDLDRSKRELKRWVFGDLQEVRLTADSEGAKLEDRIAFRERELANKMDDMYKLKKLISAFKGLENKIAYHKYVEGMTLEEIAEHMSYSASYVYKKHAEIIKRIKFVEELALY
jgi:DNA-directed RNA polymerase specialized sigma subunit